MLANIEAKGDERGWERGVVRERSFSSCDDNTISQS
jgi:hypothetical protein